MMQDLVRFVILIAVFGSTLLIVELLIRYLRSTRGQARAINKRLQLISRGNSREQVFATLLRRGSSGGSPLPWPLSIPQASLDRLLRRSGSTSSSNSVLLYLLAANLFLFVGVSIAAFSAGYGLTAGRLIMIGAFATAASWGTTFFIIARNASARRKKLVEQFPVALDVFVRGLRAGHPIASALELLTSEMTDPIGSEFGLVVDEITYGADIRDALQNMADRCGNEDMHMFVVSLAVQSETGGNLAEILEGLSAVIRDRASMLMKVRALSSEGRMSGVMLTVLPIFSFIALFLISPSFYLEVADDPIFLPAFAGLIMMFFIGTFMIRRLVDLKV